MNSAVHLALSTNILTLLLLLSSQHSNAQGYRSTFLDKQDIEHIKHDVKEHYFVNLDEKVQQRELDFYNFQLHDYDNNLLLDGLELMVALNHDADQVPSEAAKLEKMNIDEKRDYWQNKYENDAKIVDHILQQYDMSNDGHISFVEYMNIKSKLK